MRRFGKFIPVSVSLVLGCFLAAASAQAQFPQGVASGASPQSRSALVTLALPAVLGVNVAHNFVLDFNSATKCWGTTSTQGTFPQAASGNTTYRFAVSTASIPSTANVGCPGAGAQADVGTVQVFSTTNEADFSVSIVNGGQGAQATAFTGLIPDIFSANRLQLTIPGGDTCGGGTKVSPLNLGTGETSQVWAIPATGWSNCNQTLSLTLAAATPITAGTATGTMTFTMFEP